jgi:hypothetical protein
MLASTQSDLLKRWRRQVAARHHRTSSYRPRSAGALAFLTDGGRHGELVELGKLLALVVYDEPVGRDRPAVRVAGYRASRIDHGVQWGGPDHARIFKNLALAPRPGARGERFDLHDVELLEAALGLDRRVAQAARYPATVRNRSLRLPRLWAGFTLGLAGTLRGEGPELEALASRFGLPIENMFRKFHRPHEGLVLCPLAWVSDQLASATAVYAELAGLPRKQAFDLSEFPDGLVGFEDAMGFDFYESAFRRKRCEKPQGRTLSLA